MCTSQQHQKDLKLIVTTRMDKRVQVNPPPSFSIIILLLFAFSSFKSYANFITF